MGVWRGRGPFVVRPRVGFGIPSPCVSHFHGECVLRWAQASRPATTAVCSCPTRRARSARKPRSVPGLYQDAGTEKVRSWTDDPGRGGQRASVHSHLVEAFGVANTWPGIFVSPLGKMKVCPTCHPTTRPGYTVFFSSTTHAAWVPVPAIAAGGTAMIVAGSANTQRAES